MKATLTLEDGFTLTGESVTGEIDAGGETIFTTAMSGYQEVLTDPSYHGQLVCMTWPLIGNYGINHEDMESAAIHASALIVKECCKNPSNWRSELSLPEFLKKFDTPCIEGIDTRALTRHLRINGAMRGVISTSEHDPEILASKARELPAMKGRNLVPHVAAKTLYTWRDNQPRPIIRNSDGSIPWAGTGLPLVVYDYGIKWNILRHLVEASFEPVCVPPDFSPEDVKASGACGVFLSNGPGDPATLKNEIAIIKEISKSFPLVGICLGHQLIAHALGATTDKLKFGHHGCNHPVKDLTTGKIEISSQNHGFHVLLPENGDLEATHINLNDGTNEGLRHKSLPIMSLQYHPEAAAGPKDGTHLFNRFHRLISEAV